MIVERLKLAETTSRIISFLKYHEQDLAVFYVWYYL